MIKTRLFLLILLCLSTLSFAPEAGPAGTTKPVVVMIDHEGSGFVYKINSIPVSVDKGLLYTLTFMKGSHSESILLVHEDVKLSMLLDAYGVMGKAGYVHPEIFYFSRRKDWMAGLTLSKVVPFSAEGNVVNK